MANKEIVIHVFNNCIVNAIEYKTFFKNLNNGKYLVTFKDIRKRSIPQNSYYWAVVVPMIQKGLYEQGWDEIRTAEDAHKFIKSYHCRFDYINKQTGEFITVEGTTTEYTVPEFSEYLERVCKWSAEWLGIYIPSPNEQFAIFNEWEGTINEES